MYTLSMTLNQVLKALGYRTEPSRHHGKKNLITPDGKRLDGYTANSTWELLRERHPEFFAGQASS